MPLIPTGLVNLQIFAITLVVGAIAFWFLYRTSHAQLSKPTDCVATKTWSAWGECTSNCQGGQQYRTRSIAQLPLNGGRACTPSDLIESRSCNDTVQCGQNCIPGNPNLYEWAPCPPCANTGVQPVQYKYVPPLQTATQGGQDCGIDDVFLYRSCEKVIPPCPPDIDCVLTPYYETPCNVPCGSGTKFVYSSISRFPSGNGKECDMGLLVTQEACYLGPCNCDSLTWSGTFSECNAACGPGIRIMMRDPQPTNPADGLCPFFSITSCELTACPNTTCTAPSVDFVQALCYLICAGFSTTDINIDPSICLSDDIFNAVCGFNASTIQAMLSDVPGGLDESDPFVRASMVSTWFGFDNCQPPRDCSLSSFSSFSACSLQGCQLEFPYGGTRTRVRVIEDAGNSGGIPCTDQIFIDYEPCNNYTSVTYTAWNEGQQTFVTSVSNPQCTSQTCQLSNWYSVTGFQGGCGPTCTQVWNRSITDPGSNPGTCPTNPVFFVSTSTCCGVSPDAQQSNCGSLPACISCLWQTYTSLSLNCPGGIVGTRTVTIDAVLKSETNIPGQNCFALGQQCNWTQTVQNAPTWSANSCSSFFRVCTSSNFCPSGCDGLVCSGHGTYSISTVSGNPTCTCVCDPGFSGSFCSNVLPRCPVASVSGLECNGLGTCSGSPNYTCSCDNPNDTSAACTGSSTAWCWVYGITSGLFSNNTTTAGSVRKLLGAIPIASTSTYTFTEQNCLSLSEFGTISYPTSSSLTFVRPQPVLVGMNAIPGNASTLNSSNVVRSFFQGFVESRPPATLITQLASPSYCHDFSFPQNTQNILSQTFGQAFSSKFIPRFLPGTSPLQCESLYTMSVFSAFAQQSLSVLSLSQAAVQGPKPPPFAGVGKVISCQTFAGGAVATFSYRTPTGASGALLSDVFVPSPSVSTPLTLTDVNGTSTTFTYDPFVSSANYTFAISAPNFVMTFPSTAACQALLTSTAVTPARFLLPSPSL